MESQAIHRKLTSIFRKIFQNDSLVISNSTTANEVVGWDSLNHVNLIFNIESEFNFQFEMHEIIELQNVGDLLQVIGRKTLIP